MPWLSRKQARWGHANAGKLGGPGAVKEWDQATTFSGLPERSDPVHTKKEWLGGAIKKPGALTSAAKDHGVSKPQEAEKESHSKARGRGALGMRLIKGSGKP